MPTIAATAIVLSRFPSLSPLSPSHLCCAFNCRRHCITVAPSIANAIASPSCFHCLRQKCFAAGSHYDDVVCSLPPCHPPTVQEEKGGVPPRYGYAPEVLVPTLLLYLNLSRNGAAVPTAPPTSSLAKMSLPTFWGSIDPPRPAPCPATTDCFGRILLLLVFVIFGLVFCQNAFLPWKPIILLML